MIDPVNVYLRKLAEQGASTPAAPDREAAPQTPSEESAERSRTVSDTVDISVEAQQYLRAETEKNAAQAAKIAYFEQFRPVRDGFSARNLAQGMVDPSAQPFSQNRSFDEVAQAARDELDARYQQMRDSGEPYNSNNFEGIDDHSLFGNLDRRALYAVASNEGDHFTKEEQQKARDLMRGQQGMAMGLYQGPTRLAGKFANPAMVDHEQSFKAGIEFLDLVSTEEKSTDVEWATQRAITQHNYEDKANDNGHAPENFDIGHPLVSLILEALDAWEDHPGWLNKGNTETADQLRDQPWFQNHADRLDDAIADTRALYGLVDA
jgi:hypothetical protein